MNITKRIFMLMDERDTARRNEEMNRKNWIRDRDDRDKYKKLVEAIYLQRDNMSQALISEHLGPKWGINLEMRETYSPGLKQQLETQLWPVVTVNS